MKFIITFIFVLFVPIQLFAFGSGSGTCVIDKDYNSITLMLDRFRNFNSGTYTVSTNLTYYTANQPVEITIAGPIFTGIVFSVVDEFGNNVGIFDSAPDLIHDCAATVAITHSGSFGSVASYTLFWIPPSNHVGKVYILGYILKGTRGNTLTQEFFRFVRDDESAISINPNDIFSNSFE